jgi:hypothetical protein
MTTGELMQDSAWLGFVTPSAERVTARMPIAIGFVTRVTPVIAARF